MGVKFRQLSRTIAFALRHRPEQFGLQPDQCGWVPLPALLAALRQRRPEWAELCEEDIRNMMAASTKQRFELAGGRIRALYGHSIPGQVYTIPLEPPERLYHGTSPRALAGIRKSGLLPMGRQYVHLSVEVGRAVEVGKRRAESPVVITVLARQAHKAGVRFYRADDAHWLSEPIPPQFLCFDQ